MSGLSVPGPSPDETVMSQGEEFIAEILILKEASVLASI